MSEETKSEAVNSSPLEPAVTETDREIIATKLIRISLDQVLRENIKTMPPSREIALCRTKVEEAIMWAGMNLKRLNDGRVAYPNSYIPNTTVDPMKDGVKL